MATSKCGWEYKWTFAPARSEHQWRGLVQLSLFTRTRNPWSMKESSWKVILPRLYNWLPAMAHNWYLCARTRVKELCQSRLLHNSLCQEGICYTLAATETGMHHKANVFNIRIIMHSNASLRRSATNSTQVSIEWISHAEEECFPCDNSPIGRASQERMWWINQHWKSSFTPKVPLPPNGSWQLDLPLVLKANWTNYGQIRSLSWTILPFHWISE